MTKRQPSITAGELLARLEADPEWAASRAREEATLEREATELRRAEQPLLADLRRVGVDVESVWSVNRVDRAVAEVLAKHLSQPYPPAIREGIARALAVPSARPFWAVIVAAYRKEPSQQARDGLADALASIVSDATFDEYALLVHDRLLGQSRLLLLGSLMRFGDRGAALLTAVRDDPDLAYECDRLLRRLRRTKSDDAMARQQDGLANYYPPGSLVEVASRSMDLAAVRSFLEALNCPHHEVERTMTVAEALDVEETEVVDLTVDIMGEMLPVRLELFADDVDVIDLYVLAPVSSAARIAEVVGEIVF